MIEKDMKNTLFNFFFFFCQNINFFNIIKFFIKKYISMTFGSVFDEISDCQNQLNINKDQFKKLVAAENFNAISIPSNINPAVNELQTKIKDLKVYSKNFSESFKSIVQMKNVELINHRLQIATNIRKCCNLYTYFVDLYNKNVLDQSILDIVQLIRIYYKLKHDILPYVKIQVCNEIMKDIDKKIEGVREIIVKKIQYIGFSNLSLSELFQLIIISSSAEQFWSFFDFIEALLMTNNYADLPENVEKMFLFMSKIEKLSLLMNQPALSNYIESIQKMKNHYSNIIFKNINCLKLKINDVTDFPTFTKEIFDSISQITAIESNEIIPVQFKKDIKHEIEEVALFVFERLSEVNDVRMFQSLYNDSDLSDFLFYLSNLSRNLKLFIDPPNHEKLNDEKKTSKIIILLLNVFKYVYKRSFSSLSSIAKDVIILTNLSMKSNEDSIGSFKKIFYNVSRFEFISIIASLFEVISSVPKGFNKIYKNKYDFICTKFDEGIDIKNEKVKKLIEQVRVIVDLTNEKNKFYGDLESFVNDLCQAYDKAYDKALKKPKILSFF